MGKFGVILCTVLGLAIAGAAIYFMEGKTYDFPSEITLRNQEGVKISATILGRSAEKVFFVRESDGQEFEYLIADLDVKSRQEVLKFPEGGKGIKTQYVRDKMLLVSGVDKRISRVLKDLEESRAQGSRTRTKGLNDELSRLLDRKRKAQLSINDYEAKNDMPKTFFEELDYPVDPEAADSSESGPTLFSF